MNLPRNLLRPASPRQAIVLLISALVCFGVAVLTSHTHSFICIPLLVIGAVLLVWGARKPTPLA